MVFIIHVFVKCSHEYQVPRVIPRHTKIMSTKKWLWLSWLHFAERWFKFGRKYGQTHYCVCPGVFGIEHCQGPLLCDQMTMPALVATRETVCTRRTSNGPNLSCQRQGIIEKGIILISKSLRSYYWAPTNITVPERYNPTTTKVMLNAILIKIPTFFTK